MFGIAAGSVLALTTGSGDQAIVLVPYDEISPDDALLDLPRLAFRVVAGGDPRVAHQNVDWCDAHWGGGSIG